MSQLDPAPDRPPGLLDIFLGREEADQFRAGRQRQASQEAARWRFIARQMIADAQAPTAPSPNPTRAVTAREIATAIQRDPHIVRQALLDLLLADLAILVARLVQQQERRHA